MSNLPRSRGAGHQTARRPVVLGAVALTAMVALAGCGASSSGSPGPSGSSSGTSGTSSFRKCLEDHGVNPPAGFGGGFGGGGFGGGGSSSPRPRPSGSAATSFRKAMQACGGGLGGHHPGSAG